MEEATVSPTMFNNRNINMAAISSFLTHLFVLLNKLIELTLRYQIVSSQYLLRLCNSTQILDLNMTFHPDTLPNLKGKIFIVTGGNSGM